MTEPAIPRIAYILSGLPRFWRECLPSQLALLEKYPHDIFFHFWDVVDDREKQEILDLLKPRAYRFEPPRDFSDADTDPTIIKDQINIPSRTFSQYYSWREAGKLAAEFKNDYGISIRSRADLQFVYSLDHILPRLKPLDLVSHWWVKQATFCDLFAVGGIDPILYYHTLYDHVRAYAAVEELNPENMLVRHFKNRPDINTYVDENQLYFVRRPHMTNYTTEQAMAENPGRNKWLDPEMVEAHAAYHEKINGEKGLSYLREFRSFQLDQLDKEVIEKKRSEKN